MMSNINVMVDEEITKEATEIFTKLGFDMNTAINIFLRSAIRKKGIPFDLLVEIVILVGLYLVSIISCFFLIFFDISI